MFGGGDKFRPGVFFEMHTQDGEKKKITELQRRKTCVKINDVWTGIILGANKKISKTASIFLI